MSARDHLSRQFHEVNAAIPAITEAIGGRYVHTDWGVSDTHSPSCKGSCEFVAERVQEVSHGITYPHMGRMRLFHADMPRKEHVVNVHKGHIVDYTLRQFDPDAEVPTVEPIKDYMHRFGYTAAERDS